MRALLPSLLLLPSVASAMPWYVSEQGDPEHVEVALTELWPSHPMDVVVGTPGATGDAVWTRDGVLHMRTPAGEFTEPTATDIAAQIATARSWIREVQVQDAGWVPTRAAAAPEPTPDPPPEPEPEPEPEPDPENAADIPLPDEPLALGVRLDSYLMLSGGWNTRGGLHVAAQAGLFDRDSLGLKVGADLFDAVSLSDGRGAVQRAQGLLVWARDWQGGPRTILTTLGAGTRLAWVSRRDPETSRPFTGLSLMVSTTAAGHYWFGTRKTRRYQLGVGSSLDIDWFRVATFGNWPNDLRNPAVTLTFEIAGLWGESFREGSGGS